MTINGTIFNATCNEIIEELRNQLQLNKIQLLQVVQDTPDNLMVACPYHKDGQEQRPSMGIRKDNGICHCFACDKVVSLPELISFTLGGDDKTDLFGWQWLLKNFLTVSVVDRKDIDLDLSRRRSSTAKQYVSEEELDSYRFLHPYMRKRKLTDEVIELFDIGYDKNTQCLTFPVRDRTGGTLFVARRSVNTKYFNYPSGAEKPLYGLYELYQLPEFPKEIVICESMLDTHASYVFGKPSVALNGLGTELQFRQLRSLPCRKYILATDADSAGMQARERIKKNVPNKIITEYKWDLKQAKDINDMDKQMFDSLVEYF